MLPRKGRELAFREFVFDRQSAFMTLEVVRVREALMSSDALILKADANPKHDILADILTTKRELLHNLFEPFQRYVDASGERRALFGQATWHCSLRLRQSSPSWRVAP